MVGKSRVGSYLAETVISHMGSDCPEDAKRALFNPYLDGEDDLPRELLQQFTTNHIAHSRIIWDLAPVAWVINPAWCPSTLEPSPRIDLNCRYLPTDPGRHPIRSCNFTNRDLIYGDLFAALSED